MTRTQKAKTEDFIVKSYITIYAIWGIITVTYSVGTFLLGK